MENCWILDWFYTFVIRKKTIFATIYFVESFVENHYQDQIDMLDSSQKHKQIRNLLKTLQDDEISHKEEAIFEAKNLTNYKKFGVNSLKPDLHLRLKFQ